MRVLLLEDDTETLEALRKGLARDGHEVAAVGDAPSALALVEAREFDAAVLDIGVPGGSGFDVLAALRRRRASARVLLLTARGDVADRVAGLDRGADDYLVKPFSFAELAARLRALERRRQDEETEFVVAGLRLDLLRRSAFASGRPLSLTPLEFGLLAALVRADGEPQSRSALLRELWGYDFDPGTNVVEVHVNRVRRKLEDAGVRGLVRTVRGRGYAVG
jgi:two-component system OmpR family response regulator